MLFVPRINRLSTGCQLQLVFLHPFTLGFACSCFWRDVQEICLRCIRGYEGRLSPGRTVLSASRPARPRPAAPPCAPPRPACCMSGVLNRQVPEFEVVPFAHRSAKLPSNFSSARPATPNSAPPRLASPGLDPRLAIFLTLAPPRDVRKLNSLSSLYLCETRRKK